MVKILIYFVSPQFLRCSLSRATVAVLDLDRFKELTKERGWSKYSPNIITGEFSKLVEDFVRKWCAHLIYGLDWNRGTEEAVVEISGVEPNEVLEDLEKIRRRVEELGGSLSIGVAYGPSITIKAKSRREAYLSPLVRMATKALRKAKRSGGNRMKVFYA